MKVVINKQFGGFRLSLKAQQRLIDLNCKHMKSIDENDYFGKNTPEDTRLNDLKWLKIIRNNGKVYLDEHKYKYENRNCPLLVQVVEELGEEAGTDVSTLKIVEIPDGIEWTVEEYDGNEWIAEKHRMWR